MVLTTRPLTIESGTSWGLPRDFLEVLQLSLALHRYKVLYYDKAREHNGHWSPPSIFYYHPRPQPSTATAVIAPPPCHPKQTPRQSLAVHVRAGEALHHPSRGSSTRLPAICFFSWQEPFSSKPLQIKIKTDRQATKRETIYLWQRTSTDQSHSPIIACRSIIIFNYINVNCH